MSWPGFIGWNALFTAENAVVRGVGVLGNNIRGGAFMKISISGKGGSGKTTTAGILARAFARQGRPVLAIDGDNNPNLGIALGIPPDEVNALPVLPRELLEDVVDEEANKSQVLSMELDEIAARYSTMAPDNVRLLAMNRIDHAGKG
jgi:CO dehydrogenase maturation factor